MKRLLASLLSVMMVICFMPGLTWADTGITETSADGWLDNYDTATEFTISSIDEFLAFAEAVNSGKDFKGKTVTLSENLDFSGTADFTAVGTDTNTFKGTFDGNNKTISNVTINSTAAYQGIFGYLDSAIVKDVSLNNINVTGSHHVGTIAGMSKGTTVSGISVNTANVTATGSTSSFSYVAGIVGQGFTGSITNCKVTDVNVNGKFAGVAGISGDGYAAISNCTVSNSNIISTNWKVGGIIGQQCEGTFTISGCSVSDTVIQGSSDIGGIIGFSNYGNKTVTDCSVSNVTFKGKDGSVLDSAGGIIGTIMSNGAVQSIINIASTKVNDITFDGDDKSVTNSGGIIGNIYWRGFQNSVVNVSNADISDVTGVGTDSSNGVVFGGVNNVSQFNINDSKIDVGETIPRLVGGGNDTETVSVNKVDEITGADIDELAQYIPEEKIIVSNGTGGITLKEKTEEQKVRVGTSYYSTLEDAIQNVGSNKEIVLLDSVTTDTVTIPEGATLKTNGKSLTLNENAVIRFSESIDGVGTIAAANGQVLFQNGQSYYSAAQSEAECSASVGGVTLYFENIQACVDEITSGTEVELLKDVDSNIEIGGIFKFKVNDIEKLKGNIICPEGFASEKDADSNTVYVRQVLTISCVNDPLIVEKDKTATQTFQYNTDKSISASSLSYTFSDAAIASRTSSYSNSVKGLAVGETTVSVTRGKTDEFTEATTSFTVKVVEATVNVNIFDESGNKLATVSAEKDKPLTDSVDLAQFEKSGYILTWYQDSGCTSAWDMNTALSENMDLYAKYTPDNSEKPTAPTTPTTQKPVITADNATVTLGSYGTTATITVDGGYELVDVTVNGVSQGKVTFLYGLKTGDKVVVTTKKIQTAEDLKAEVKAIQLVARSANEKAPSGKKAIKVYWFEKNGKELNLDGYEIYRSTKKNSGYGTKPIYKTTKSLRYFNTSAKKGTRYYYKVRGYKVIEGEKVYTDYSLKAIRTAR